MTTMLIVAEIRDGAPTPLTRELIGLARSLGHDVAAIAFTPDADALSDLVAAGAARVYCCEENEDYDGELWVAATEQVARDMAPQAILAGHTTAGADLGPRLAFRLRTAVATGC